MKVNKKSRSFFSIKMNEMHPEFELLKATSGRRASLKPLPKPPNVLSASRDLRSISADEIHPIGRGKTKALKGSCDKGYPFFGS